MTYLPVRDTEIGSLVTAELQAEQTSPTINFKFKVKSYYTQENFMYTDSIDVFAKIGGYLGAILPLLSMLGPLFGIKFMLNFIKHMR